MTFTARMVRRAGFVVVGLLGLGLAWTFAPRSPVERRPDAAADAEANESPAVPEPKGEVDDEAPADSGTRAEAESSAREPRQQIRVEQSQGVTVVHFVNGKFVNDQDSRELGDQLDSLVDEAGNKKLLLNLGNVQYLNSDALTRIVLLRKKVKAAKGTIKLCGLSPDLKILFQLTKVERIFDVYPDQKSALDAF